jgi:hypothetical protein
LKKPNWKITHPDPILLDVDDEDAASNPDGSAPVSTNSP